jgi:phage portal protein BeeE
MVTSKEEAARSPSPSSRKATAIVLVEAMERTYKEGQELPCRQRTQKDNQENVEQLQKDLHHCWRCFSRDKLGLPPVTNHGDAQRGSSPAGRHGTSST